MSPIVMTEFAMKQICRDRGRLEDDVITIVNKALHAFLEHAQSHYTILSDHHRPR